VYPSQCSTSVDQKTTGIVRARLNQKLVAKHGDGVSGVAVAVSVGPRHVVAGMWGRRFSVGLMRRLVHLNLNNKSYAAGSRPSMRTKQ
jgi:hypothetical protein